MALHPAAPPPPDSAVPAAPAGREAPAGAGARRLGGAFSRWFEGLQSTIPGAAGLLAARAGSGFPWRAGSVFLAAYCLNAAAVFAWNDACDWERDLGDPRRSDARRSSRTALARRAVLLYAAALPALLLLPLKVAALGALLQALCWAYSGRRLHFKAVPGAAQAVNFTAGAGGFLAGFWAAGAASAPPSWGMLYFGLLMVSGGLWGEAIDLETDRAHGLMTAAGRLGLDRTYVAAASLQAAAAGASLLLFPGPIFKLLAAASAAVYALRWSAARGTMTEPRARLAYRRLYRLLFGLLTIAGLASAARGL